MAMKAFGYIRVSGKGQIDGDGFKRQEKAIRDYAERNGATIERIFREEGVSGSLQHRPALAEMMVSLEQNGLGVRTILIEKVDRLARDLMIQEAIINDLQKKGFNLISVVEGDDLLSGDPTRKLVRQVLGAIAEYDKTMTVLKLRTARERIRVRNGKCEGRKSYAETAPEVIREIRRLRSKRKGIGRRTYVQVAEELNRQGLTTVTEKPFTGQTVQNIMRSIKK